MSVRVRVPAKINLHLSVGPLRPDGFHELVTVFHAVDLYDEITATEADALTLTVTGEGAADLPTGDGNLAWRAAALLAGRLTVEPRVRLDVRKRIPVAGGLAGGSADAAGALLACARLWGRPAPLEKLAAELGSDVAFPLHGGTALGTGRGELLEPVPVTGELHWVLAAAHFGIPTATAYAELDKLRAVNAAPAPVGRPDALRAALAAGDVAAVGAALANDLQAAALALRPELHRTLGLGRDAGAVGAIVSGSGPTCAFLCTDPDEAEHVAAILHAEGMCRAAYVASGPAPGATAL